MCRRSVWVDGSSSSDALREGAGAGNVALLEGVVGWHRSMIGGAVGDDLGGVVGGEGLGLSGGVRFPLEGVDGWHRSMIGGAAGDDRCGVVGGELSWVGSSGSPWWAMFC